MLFILAEARILQVVCTHFGETKRLVKFPIGQKPRIVGNLASQKLQLQATVETESKIVVLAVTERVPLSLRQETHQIPLFSKG